MLKHTPGPWVITDTVSNGEFTVVRRGPNSDLKDLYTGNHADACLIASAPDMLEALEEIVDRLDGQQDIDDNGKPNDAMQVITIAYKAIAKAKGD